MHRGIRSLGWGISLLLVLATRLVAAPQFVNEAALVDRVVALIDQRLALMPEVAAIKFRQQKPIADPAREREVIEQSVAEAQAMHLDAGAARTFFALQISLARAVQEECFAQWRRGVPPPEARDLVTQLRPQLDEIGRRLLPAVYLASGGVSAIPAPELTARLAPLRRKVGTTDAALGELARALRDLRIVAAPSWSSLQRVGVLRVGTTGDYAPFSETHGDGLRGVDVDLAQALAQSWGVTVVFVRTSWPALMEDLARHRFDVALSGISITPERRRLAGFSLPYYTDGKTPIARREHAARFASLEQIDQPGVRVIVNPGGTNERFVRERLKTATIMLHADNRTIFDELVAGRADVMITDGIEVRLQERRHPELRGTRATPFTAAGKAMLLPKESDLVPRVDGWLKEQLASGAIAHRFERALNP